MILRYLKGKFGQRGPNLSGTLLGRFGPPDQTFLLSIVVSCLVADSICKPFADVCFALEREVLSISTGKSRMMFSLSFALLFR